MSNVRPPRIVHPRHPIPPKNTAPGSLATKDIYSGSKVKVVSDESLSAKRDGLPA